MPKLLRPAAPRFIRSHPLAVGMADAVLFDGDRGVNYGNTAAQPAFSGAMTAGYTADSPGSLANGTGANYATVAGSYNIAAGVFTVSALWRPISNSNQFTNFLEKSNGGSREWSFFVFYNTNIGNISYYTVGTTLSGDVNLATAMAPGGTYRLTVTRNTSNLLTLYVNGISKATTTNAGNTAVAGSAWQVGRQVSGGAHPNAAYGDLFVWPARCLSSDEVMQHAAEPWAMLRPSGRLIRAATGATVALTGQSAAFAQGPLGKARSTALTGQSAAFGQGSLGKASAVELGGQTAAFAQGNVGIGGNVTVALTGQAATFGQGDLTVGVPAVAGGSRVRRGFRRVRVQGEPLPAAFMFHENALPKEMADKAVRVSYDDDDDAWILLA